MKKNYHNSFLFHDKRNPTLDRIQERKKLAAVRQVPYHRRMRKRRK
ncbi:hypothetical protein [Pseudoflavonifractor phocaeensis]|nr:hypothetical protein [Pseudoflavonifractor phocaeensis]MBM6925485.1 hypothetical protein [Pseudoflavonifractor phocaeensis]